MSALAIAGVSFACIFGAAVAGMLARRFLPEHHLSSESKDVVKLGMGFIATLTALVIGLLVATAKGTSDAQSGAVQELGANVVLLDRLLALYGPETKEPRELLKGGATATLHRLWPDDPSRTGDLAPGEARAALESLYEKVAGLSPQNDVQRSLKARALDLTTELARGRLRLFARQDASLPTPLLVVLVFWLSVLFAGYGLMTHPNATVVTVLLVCSLSICGAILLIMELGTPFGGMLRISSAPLHDAIALLGN